MSHRRERRTSCIRRGRRIWPRPPVRERRRNLPNRLMQLAANQQPPVGLPLVSSSGIDLVPTTNCWPRAVGGAWVRPSSIASRYGSLRRIQQATGVRRETAGTYLKAAGITVRPPRGWERGAPAKPAKQVITDSAQAKPAKEVITHSGAIDFGEPGSSRWAVADRSPRASACDQPSRPRANTCCFFSSVKTLAMPREATSPPTGVNVPGLAPFGRFSGDTHWPVLTDH